MSNLKKELFFKPGFSTLFFSFIFIFISSPLWAASLDLSVSDDAAQIKYESPYDITSTYYSIGLSNYNSEENGVDVDATSGFIGFAVTEKTNENTRLGLGARFYHLSVDVDNPLVDDLDGGALTIGGFVHLFFPDNERVRFRADAYFGPGVLAYSDLDEYAEFSFQLEYKAIQNAVLMLGYREVSVEVIDVDFDLEDDIFFGISLEF